MTKGRRSPAYKFRADLQKWYQANVSPTGGGLEWVRQVALDLIGEIVDRSPRKTGRFVANWQVGIGGKPTGFRWQMRDPDGSQAIRAALVALQSMRTVDTIWIANHAPYALRLERGSSSQAPYGMVALSLEAVGQRYSVAGVGMAQFIARGRFRGMGGLQHADNQAPEVSVNWSQVVNAARKRFADRVATPRSLVVVHGNQPVNEKSLVGRWARLSTQAAARTQISTGAPGHRRFRCAGIMFAVLMEPLNRGDGEQNDLVDAIQAAFSGVTLHLQEDVTVRFRPPLPVGEAFRDGSWWTRTVEIPFEYDEFGGEAP